MPYIVNELTRFRMLMIGVCTGIGISSTYGFSMFTEPLKAKYGFSQSDITTISTVGNCIGYLSFFAGMLFDFGGPKVVFLIAGLLGFLGFLLFGLAFDDVIPAHKGLSMVVQFGVFNAILYLGCPAMDVATLMPLMLNFPLDRGFIVIIQKTFSGLGTSVLMAYFNGWFLGPNGVKKAKPDDNNYAGYAYFLGVQLLFVAILGMVFIDMPPYFPSQYVKKRLTEGEEKARAATLQIYMNQPAPRRRLYIGCVLVVLMLCFLTVSSIVPAYTVTAKTGFVVISVVAVILVAAFSLMALPFQLLGRFTPAERSTQFAAIGIVGTVPEGEGDSVAELDELDATNVGSAVLKESPMDEVGDVAKPIECEHADSGVNEPTEAEVSPVGEPQYHGSFWSHLLTVDLWLLWVGFFGMWGTGTVMQMNAAQIYRSKAYGDYVPSQQTLYVALMGVGSAVGRIASGAFDMVLSTRQREGRSEMLTTTGLPVGAVLLFLAYLLFAVVPAGGLIVPFLIGSAGTGIGWGIGALCLRIMYAEDIGKHYNFMFSSGFVCTIVLNRFMFGGMFDNEAKKRASAPHCDHPICVRNQMFILMAVNVVACVAAVITHLRFARYVAREKARRG